MVWIFGLPQNLCVEALTVSAAVFVDEASTEVIKVKIVH